METIKKKKKNMKEESKRKLPTWCKREVKGFCKAFTFTHTIYIHTYKDFVFYIYMVYKLLLQSHSLPSLSLNYFFRFLLSSQP